MLPTVLAGRVAYQVDINLVHNVPTTEGYFQDVRTQCSSYFMQVALMYVTEALYRTFLGTSTCL